MSLNMALSTVDDPNIILMAYEMKLSGMLVSDIARKLSVDTGERITQMALWRLFDSLKEEDQKELLESDYPSDEDITYLFNKKTQKEKNSTIIKHLSANNKEITIRRDLMIRILTNYYSKEFTLNEVKVNCNDRDSGGENFLAHWNYLLKYNYIEKVDDYKFKFCDRVRKWKTFGQI